MVSIYLNLKKVYTNINLYDKLYLVGEKLWNNVIVLFKIDA